MTIRRGFVFAGMLFVIIGLSTQVLAKPCHGMVVTAQHLATKVGQNILEKGGNAIDAAVAVAYALSVVEPCCGNIGGGGFMLIHFNTGKNIVLNFREKAPLDASAAWYLNKMRGRSQEELQEGYQSVAVPGTVLGLNTALKKYGTLPLKVVMKPAIQLAEKGFRLVPGDVAVLKTNWPQLKKQANIRAIFSKNGRMLGVGDYLVQKDLATSLKEIAKKGSAAFYRGKIAHQIVAASKKHGGLLTKTDFLNYEIETQSPLRCSYRGYQILALAPPSSGGVILCEILQILSAYPLAQFGYQQGQGLHYILESMRLAYQDRRKLGDPDFVKNPLSDLLSLSHAKDLREQINPFKAGHFSAKAFRWKSAEKPETTHFSIVDPEGNAVALTYTLNGFFGAKVMAEGTGIFLNNEMDDFALSSETYNQFALKQGYKNSIQAGKRPLSSMTPTIVLKKGKIYMVLGSAGGSTIPTQVLEVLLNHIDYRMNLKEAVNAPRFHFQGFPNLVYREPEAFGSKTLRFLEEMGYFFQLGSPFHTLRWGAVAAILVDPKTGEMTGVIDKRRPAGLAAGVRKY